MLMLIVACIIICLIVTCIYMYETQLKSFSSHTPSLGSQSPNTSSPSPSDQSQNSLSPYISPNEQTTNTLSPNVSLSPLTQSYLDNPVDCATVSFSLMSVYMTVDGYPVIYNGNVHVNIASNKNAKPTLISMRCTSLYVTEPGFPPASTLYALTLMGVGYVGYIGCPNAGTLIENATISSTNMHAVVYSQETGKTETFENFSSTNYATIMQATPGSYLQLTRDDTMNYGVVKFYYPNLSLP